MSERTYPVRGELLLRLMESKGVSQTALADQVEVHAKTIRRMCAGGESFLESIQAVAKALGVEPDTLRADIEPGAKPAVTAFSLDISIQGQFEGEGHLAGLLTLTPSIVAKLAAAGIKINSYRSGATITEMGGGEPRRIVVLIYGMLETGGPFYAFAAVMPSRYRDFTAAQRTKTLDLYSFDSFGEIIVSGEGKQPPDDIIQQVAAMYEVTPARLMDLAEHPADLPE